MADKISEFLSTPVLHHGPGALGRLPVEIERLNGNRIGVLTDAGLTATGIKGKTESVTRKKLHWFEDVEPEPSMESVEHSATFLKEQECDVAIAVGGGSVIDTGKMASVLAEHGGKVMDYYTKSRDFLPGIPLIAIPTTAGTGSEATPAAVFRDPENGAKRGIRYEMFMPAAAILDPELTTSLPAGLTASTGMDALTHALEAYVSPLATVFSDMAAERAISLVFSSLKIAVENGKDLEARENMLNASYLAGVSIAIANVGAVHGLAHTLGGLHKVAHGLANAMLLPYIMEFNNSVSEEKYAAVAGILGEADPREKDAAGKARHAVSRLARDVGIPQSFKEIGVPETAIEQVADLCLETQARILSFNPRPMNKEQAVAILRQAYEGPNQ